MVLFWTLIAAAAIIALALGLFLGGMPLRNDAMSEAQQKYSQLGGMLAFGFFVMLVILRQDAASWVLVGGLVTGFAIAKIPMVSKALSSRFTIFRAAPRPAAETRRRSAKKRK